LNHEDPRSQDEWIHVCYTYHIARFISMRIKRVFVSLRVYDLLGFYSKAKVDGVDPSLDRNGGFRSDMLSSRAKLLVPFVPRAFVPLRNYGQPEVPRIEAADDDSSDKESGRCWDLC
jgi:hypothetical protein